MDGGASVPGGLIIPIRIVVRGVPIIESVGDDLINALSLPKRIPVTLRIREDLNTETERCQKPRGREGLKVES